MKMSDLIIQLVNKYGQVNQEMSKKCRLSPNTKYLRLYDHPEFNYAPIDTLAIDPKKGKSKLLKHVNFPDLDPSWEFDHLHDVYGRLDDPNFNDGEAILFSIANTLVINNQFPEDLSERKIWLNDIREKCSNKIELSLGENKEFNQLCDEISNVVQKKYNNHLEFPSPISMLHRCTLLGDNASWINATGISTYHCLNIINNDGSDMICPNMYSLEFLKSLNDLIGGVGEDGKRDIDMDNIENITSKEVLDRLIEANGGEMPFHSKLHGVSGYVCDKLCRRKDGYYYVKYHIYPPSGEHNPELQETVSIQDIEEMCGKDMVNYAKEYHKEFKQHNAHRFKIALQDLMPNIYEELAESKIEVNDYDELMKWYKTKERINAKLSDLKEKTSTDNVLDVSKTKIQVLREIARDNISPKKGITNRKLSDDSITKQTARALLSKVTKDTSK